MIDLDTTELSEEIVKELLERLEILYPNGEGRIKAVKSLRLSYVFGNGQYIKDVLDEYSKSFAQSERKLPLVALSAPMSEDRDDADHFPRAKVSLVIVCSSRKERSNEMRKIISLKNILWPIYRRLLGVLYEDSRFDCDYDEKVRHGYSKSYSRGKYGAYTDSGEAMSEPIDATSTRSMETKINSLDCRRK